MNKKYYIVIIILLLLIICVGTVTIWNGFKDDNAGETTTEPTSVQVLSCYDSTADSEGLTLTSGETDTSKNTAVSATGNSLASTKSGETTAAGSTGKTVSTTAGSTTGLNNEEIDEMPVPAVITIDEGSFSMTLVNRKYRIPENYSVKTAPSISGSEILLDERVAPYYQAMYKAAKADGITLTPCSGFRSYSRQKSNYENKINEYIAKGFSRAQSETLAARSIMPPGSSEHNLGLCMDIIVASSSAGFEKTKEYKWLTENAEEFGFILRYPADKTEITQVKFEPWHWRYVGTENARAINASGKCLEEYLGQSAK